MEMRRAQAAYRVWSIGPLREDIFSFYAASVSPSLLSGELFKLLTINSVAFRNVIKILYRDIQYTQFPWNLAVPEVRWCSGASSRIFR